MTPQHWTAQNRDALLTRVTALTAGTAVVGAVGAVGLGVAIAATNPPKATATHKARTTPATAPVTPVTPKTPASNAAKMVTADQVPVLVLNGIGTAGAAHTAAQELSTAGFQITGIGNLRGGPIGASTIIYPASLASAAQVLAQATGVSSLDPSGSGSSVILVVGPDWTGNVVTPSGQTIHASFAPPPAPPQQQSGGTGGGIITSGGS